MTSSYRNEPRDLETMHSIFLTVSLSPRLCRKTSMRRKTLHMTGFLQFVMYCFQKTTNLLFVKESTFLLS